MTDATKKIAILMFQDGLALDATGPAEAFSIANGIVKGADKAYDLRFVSAGGGPVRMSSGMVVETERTSDTLLSNLDTLIVSGGPGAHFAAKDRALLDWIRKAGRQVNRICSVCSGAFILAEAGLLDNRRAVTHWDSVDQLRADYPAIRVDMDPIFIEDGNVWTSAGVTAGIDMTLALIGKDHGAGVSSSVARQLVVFLQRPGGQAQFSQPLKAQSDNQDGSTPIVRISSLIAENLSQDLSVANLAEMAGMSPRSLARVFENRRDGLTAAKLVENIRVEAAVRALSQTAKPIKSIAADCGFRSEERMRCAFIRRFGVPPGSYRDRFNPPEAAE